MVHDISYNNGFTAASGNFQQNNYGQGGLGNDRIDGKVQSGLNDDQLNNATYSHSTEGQSPEVNMFIWSNSNNGLLTVNAPSNVAGTYETGGTVDFGGAITTSPLTGEVVIAQDNIPNPTLTDGCETIETDLTGKIAIIDRGGCDFSLKAFNAQEQGATACIICNFEDQIINMSGGDQAANCLLYTSPSPRDATLSRMPSSA